MWFKKNKVAPIDLTKEISTLHQIVQNKYIITELFQYAYLNVGTKSILLEAVINVNHNFRSFDRPLTSIRAYINPKLKYTISNYVFELSDFETETARIKLGEFIILAKSVVDCNKKDIVTFDPCVDTKIKGKEILSLTQVDGGWLVILKR